MWIDRNCDWCLESGHLAAQCESRQSVIDFLESAGKLWTLQTIDEHIEMHSRIQSIDYTGEWDGWRDSQEFYD